MKLYKVIIGIAIISALVCLIAFFPVDKWLTKVLEFTRGLGFWGPVLVIALYIAACVLLLPGSVLTLGAGFVFHLVVGIIIVSIGSTLGACTAFLIGRGIARNWVERKVAANPKFAAIDEAVGQQGFKIVLLTRLSPVIPFNLQNYAYALTRVSFRQYALASWLGMIPGTIMYVYIGTGLSSLAAAAADKNVTSVPEKVFLWVGLGFTVTATVFITRVARRALRQAVAQSRVQQGRESPAK